MNFFIHQNPIQWRKKSIEFVIALNNQISSIENLNIKTKVRIRSTGTYIFIIWVVGWLGGKNDDVLRKSANIRGKRWENGKKEEIFTAPRGKISFLEMEEGPNISYFGQIFTPGSGSGLFQSRYAPLFKIIFFAPPRCKRLLRDTCPIFFLTLARTMAGLLHKE